MSQNKKTLTCILYTQVVNDFRFHAVIKAIEAILPTEPLIYTISESATLERLDDPGAWLTNKLMADDPDLICNGIPQAYIRLFALQLLPDTILETEPQAQLNVDMLDTPEFTSRLPALVQTLCPAARAYWADASPSDTTVSIIEGTGRQNPPPSESTRPFVPTKPIAVPWRFGWLNYWSNESCRLLDFAPDDPRAKLFTRVTPIEGHGVMLQLTDEPLDLDRPEHLAALTAAYDAFPDISQAYGP